MPKDLQDLGLRKSHKGVFKMSPTKNISHYRLLADIIDYPFEGYHQKVKKAMKLVVGYESSVTELLTEYLELINHLPLYKIEELYLRTFAVQAVTTLDIGYVLFGDDYKRGEFLVNLCKEHLKVKNDCGHELADNLANLLRLLSTTKYDEFKNELVGIIILPALAKIISEFDLDNIKVKNRVYLRKFKTLLEQPEAYNRLFVMPLIIIQKVLESDFGLYNQEKLVKDTNFTESIVQEIKID